MRCSLRRQADCKGHVEIEQMLSTSHPGCWEVSDEQNRDDLCLLNVNKFQNLNYDKYCERFGSSGLCIFSLQHI